MQANTGFQGGRNDALEVWLKDDIGPGYLLGILVHHHGQIRFHYDREWLEDPRSLALDPGFSLDEASVLPNSESGNLGIVLDSLPDRWGKMLMRRHEALHAKDDKREPRTLGDWDFLIGVQDLTRQGGLRFRRPGAETFLGDEKIAVPPVTALRELEAAAYRLSNPGIDDLDALRQELAVLMAPGASLGGTRPKANFAGTDGTLWIAKFPAWDDDRDVGAQEYAVHQLAKKAGLNVPPATLTKLDGESHTFSIQRFDRVKETRRFCCSAMALLRKAWNEGTSYLELAGFLRAQGDTEHADADLAQLFRRCVFSLAIGSGDDHLKNHSFMLGKTGWRLAPAFDFSSRIDKVDHRRMLKTLSNKASFYRLDEHHAQEIVEEIVAIVDDWRSSRKATLNRRAQNNRQTIGPAKRISPT